MWSPLLALLQHLADGGDDLVGVGRGEFLERRAERDGHVGAGDARDRRVELVEALLHQDPGEPRPADPPPRPSPAPTTPSRHPTHPARPPPPRRPTPPP